LKFYVYEHWRLDRDECFYVGKGIGRRAYEMAKRNPHHKAVVNKVLREGFGIEVKIVASGLTHEEASAIECERISFWRSSNIDLTNITIGGDGVPGYKHTKEFKQFISLRFKGIPKSLESRAKQSATQTGKKASEETRAKLSAAKIGNKNFFGHKHSDETKAKMRASHLARNASKKELI